MGGSRNALSVWSGAASHQMNTSPQRHRGMGHDAEVRRLEASPAQVVTG